MYLLLDLDHLYIEDQIRVGWNGGWLARRAVGQRGRDDEAADTALLHANQSFVPALDDLALAQDETERVATAIVGAIELLATALQPAGIFNRDATATFSGGSAPDLEINILYPIGCCHRRLGHCRRLCRSRRGGRWQIQFRQALIHSGSRCRCM